MANTLIVPLPLMTPHPQHTHTYHMGQLTIGGVLLLPLSLLERQTDRTVGARAVLPMRDDLPRGGAVRHRAVLAGLARRHVVQHVLHGAAVRQLALHKYKLIVIASEIIWHQKFQ